MSLIAHMEGYSLSSTQLFLSVITLTNFPYAQRHWEMAQQLECRNPVKHYCLAIADDPLSRLLLDSEISMLMKHSDTQHALFKSSLSYRQLGEYNGQPTQKISRKECSKKIEDLLSKAKGFISQPSISYAIPKVSQGYQHNQNRYSELFESALALGSF